MHVRATGAAEPSRKTALYERGAGTVAPEGCWLSVEGLVVGAGRPSSEAYGTQIQVQDEG
jgi:hypothetical protein